MKIGYARVSTSDQNLDLQVDALKKDGCKRIFYDVLSGTSSSRPGLDDALECVKKGDVLVVWRLDRMGRSLQHLITLLNDLNGRGVEFRSINDPIDTTTAFGKCIYSIFGAIAEFERNLMIERTMAGLDAARKRGRIGGRPEALDDNQKLAICEMFVNDGLSMNTISKQVGVSRQTVSNYLHKRGLVI